MSAALPNENLTQDFRPMLLEIGRLDLKTSSNTISTEQMSDSFLQNSGYSFTLLKNSTQGSRDLCFCQKYNCRNRNSITEPNSSPLVVANDFFQSIYPELLAHFLGVVGLDIFVIFQILPTGEAFTVSQFKHSNTLFQCFVGSYPVS